MLSLNNKYLEQFVEESELSFLQNYVNVTDDMIRQKTGQGNDFLGWVNLPEDHDKDEFNKIKLAAEKIKKDSEILLVIGIGGSYLGAKAVIDFLANPFNTNGPEIIFVGHNISSTYISDLTDYIEGKDFSINIISKSGTTTEPAIAFRHFKKILNDKYGADATNRIYATTDKERGALKEQVNANGWESFVVPDDVGGRFSVLTAVGLLPIAASGVDIDDLMSGAKEAQVNLQDKDLNKNDAYKYAALRNILYRQGKEIELLVGYEPALQYFNEWFKQLFAESEGKDGKGIFPSSVIFSTDLHSLGQGIQSGRRNLFETVININDVRKNVKIELAENDGDGLNYLAGKDISFVNQKAFEATALAHVEGGVPNIVLELKDMSAKSMGYMIYFFELSCAMSGYLSGVNPFDQPGVEAYKKNMFALLGKPGFEEHRALLESK